ncbi:ABC-F family ATP-binding cassette domain-containing protein [Candidatus Babeliales bacterium]|nr:ABC-F family ATP-binding cassette domain-containing protein [Candidatus Babeliales bacterium]
MIQLKNICLSFGSQVVFDHINTTFSEDERIGLVGRNGSGKSTLIKAISGNLRLDDGSISVSGKARIAYMPQEVVMTSDKSILEEALSSVKDIGPLRERAQQLELLLENEDPAVVEEYAHIMERLAELHVDEAVRNTKTMLQGLGFKEKQLNDPVMALSVGWQMRVVLAKLLLQQADFYLFDEPTNHLDIVAKDWFLEFLQDSSFGFVLVCHDRYFLDKLANRIVELDRGLATDYYGNYEDYEEQKERNLLSLKSAHALQQKELKHKKELIEKFKAKASKAKMAKSMQKSLEKIDIIEIPQDARTVHFNFQNTQRAGRVVLEVENVAFSYDAKEIFKNVSFTIERGEKVALVAPNGVGKTTLFNTIIGKNKLQTGRVHFGHNVHPVIFEQEQHKILDPNKSVVDEVFAHVSNKTEQQIRSFLGMFLFSKDSVNKKTKVLSGGERNRLSMVKVLLQDANFLLLDEPTNHLDIQSKEVLLRALQQFDGTIFFVSHDHDFMNKLATRVIELTPNGIHSYFGNYEEFLIQKHAAQGENSHDSEKKSGKKDTSLSESKQVRINNNEDKKELQRVERKISSLEKEIEKLNCSFGDLEYGTDEFDQVQEKVTIKEKELKEYTQIWEKLSEKE